MGVFNNPITVIAINKLGSFIMLYAILNNIKVKASREIPRHGLFFCCNPNCSQPNLILKKGNHRIPHFAHRVECDCDKLGEKETDAHIEIKNWFEFFLKSDFEVEYTRIPGVKPDLLWKGKYAIEVQHSPISIEEIIRRNEIYIANGISPVWIFHAREPVLRNDNGDVVSTISLHAGIYGKKISMVGKLKVSETYRLRDVEKFFADTQLITFYFQFSSGTLNTHRGNFVKLIARYYHPYAENMVDYWDFYSEKSTFYSASNTEKIVDPKEFSRFIANQKFTKEIIAKFGLIRRPDPLEANIIQLIGKFFDKSVKINSYKEFRVISEARVFTLHIRKSYDLYKEFPFVGDTDDEFSIFLLTDLEQFRNYEYLISLKRNFLLYLYIPDQNPHLGILFKYSDQGIELIENETKFWDCGILMTE